MKRLRRTGPALLRTCALAGALTSFPCPGSLARAEQVVENHGDGSPKVRYGTDAEGRRDGPYEELFPDGTPKVKGTYLAGEKHGNWTTRNESGKVVESATYRNGVLHGPYTAGFPSGKPRLKAKYKAGAPAGTVTVLDEKGKTERVVTYPRARDEVEKAWAKLYVKHPAPPAFTEEPSLDPPHRAGRLSPETVDEALRTVQLYRYLSGLTWQDMKADPALCARAQHGAVLLAELGHLTHTPPRPGSSLASALASLARAC